MSFLAARAAIALPPLARAELGARLAAAALDAAERRWALGARALGAVALVIRSVRRHQIPSVDEPTARADLRETFTY